MASSYTSNLNLEKPGVGEQSGEWGTTVNDNMDLIDTAVNAKIPKSDLLDEDNMASDSATKPASQQSIKAYVDAQVASEDTLAELNDTSISTPAAGHLIIYDNTASHWENATLTAGSNVSITNADGAVTIAATDTNTQLTQEQVEDYVGGMLDGDETFITVTYDDTDGNIDFTVPVKDEDDLTSNSATHLATQQSIKAYVDAQVATEDTIAELNDTAVSSPDAGHLLIYHNTNSNWANATLTAGSNVSITNADGAITIASTDTNTQLSQEQVEDYVGGMLDGTETFIDVSYDDTDGNIDFVVPVKDEDDMTSNSATHLATQQSIKAYVDANVGSVAADDIGTGDAAVSIATSAGNITVDAQGNDTDIILKGTDGGADTTFLTLDGSEAGEATFNAGIVIADGGNIGSASDKDALAIAADGVTTFSQIPVNANNPALEARITSNQTGISHNTYTKINLNSTLYDVGSFFDTSTNYRYTPTIPGYYWFNITIYDLSATDVYDILAVLYKNGVATTIFGRHRFLGVTNDDFYASIVSASGMLHMDGDDYAELYCRIASEDSGSITVGSYYTRMSAFLMSRTS